MPQRFPALLPQPPMSAAGRWSRLIAAPARRQPGLRINLPLGEWMVMTALGLILALW